MSLEKRLVCDISLPNKVTEYAYEHTSPPLAAIQQQMLIDFKHRVAPSVMFSKAPDYKQRNVGMGIYDTATAVSITNWVKAVKAVVDEVETAILAATTEAELNNIDTTAETLMTKAEAKFALM